MEKLTIKKTKLFEPLICIYFVWYYLPIMRGFFDTGLTKRLFFSMYLIGFGILIMYMLINSRIVHLKFNMLIPILSYLIVLLFLYLFEIGDARIHLKVSFTFWNTAIVYYALEGYPETRNRLGRILTLCFIITLITSTLGVIANPSAARLLTYAANEASEDRAIKLLNIASLSFFQSSLLLIPIFVSFIFEKRKKMSAIVGLLAIFIAVRSASFAISFIMFFVVIVVSLLFNCRSNRQKVLILFVSILLLIIPWKDALTYLIPAIQNDMIVDKLNNIIAFSENNKSLWEISSRFELYQSSWKTFLNHPFGIGPKYSYVELADGIGYHSQILDDLARYGILGGLFYCIFLYKYYRLLKRKWYKMEQVAMPIVIIYMALLILNPGFTSAYEAVMVFLIIPILPDLIQEKEYKRNKHSET